LTITTADQRDRLRQRADQFAAGRVARRFEQIVSAILTDDLARQSFRDW